MYFISRWGKILATPFPRKSDSQDFHHADKYTALWHIVFLTIVPQQDICLLNPLCLTKHFLRSSRSWDGTKPGRSLELTFRACHQLRSDQLTIYLGKKNSLFCVIKKFLNLRGFYVE